MGAQDALNFLPSVREFAAATGASQVAEIREELSRIVNSAPFKDSLRLIRFLTFVVETTLAGKSAQIKAYTIAIEAFDRHASFDPQTDAIVRVEACRLRRALAYYYAGAGRGDRIVIEIARGSYVPRFRPCGPSSGTVVTVGNRCSDQATLNAVFERLMEVSRELEAMAAEIETARRTMGRPDH